MWHIDIWSLKLLATTWNLCRILSFQISFLPKKKKTKQPTLLFSTIKWIIIEKKSLESFGMYKKQKAMLKGKNRVHDKVLVCCSLQYCISEISGWKKFRSSLRLHWSGRTCYVRCYRESGFGASLSDKNVVLMKYRVFCWFRVQNLSGITFYFTNDKEGIITLHNCNYHSLPIPRPCKGHEHPVLWLIWKKCILISTIDSDQVCTSE